MINCERYKRWKKEQEFLKDPKKKGMKKRKIVITDCIEEDKKIVPKIITKIRYRKCKKDEDKTKETKFKGMIFKPKFVSSIDLLLKRIQPSLDVRNKLIDHRHYDCFIENVIKETTMTQKSERRIPKRDMKRKKIKRKKKISKDEKEKILETENEEKTATTEEEDAIAKEIIENDKKDDVNEVQPKGIVKKSKFWCKKVKKRIESESEISDECDSICSFDSEICLKRLRLTLEDKQKIEENRKRVQSSSTMHNS
ncbi:hypothetical protein M0802_012392 [Mischocyttarus mexicanus]|nr:hypothetical protein M0802_012392 [Mischocyttarus mexicanus]